MIHNARNPSFFPDRMGGFLLLEALSPGDLKKKVTLKKVNLFFFIIFLSLNFLDSQIIIWTFLNVPLIVLDPEFYNIFFLNSV
jgi:hypothetical protein